MNENHLEATCLDWLGELGWARLHGDSVSPGGELAARERYADIVLVPRLRDAVVRLKPSLSSAETDEVTAKVASFGSQSLVDGNREMYDWMRNGVLLERIESDGRRAVLRVRVVDFDGPNDLLAGLLLTDAGTAPSRGHSVNAAA